MTGSHLAFPVPNRGQVVHAEAPVEGEKVVEEQGVQVVAPVNDEAVPAAQGMHVVDPAAVE